VLARNSSACKSRARAASRRSLLTPFVDISSVYAQHAAGGKLLRSGNLYEDSCLCHRTRMASRVVTRFYDEILRSVGLRTTQLAVLVAVGNEDVMSITALAKFMGMDRSTLTRNLAPLEREGLIRVGNEGWRRSRTVEITKKGRARLREALSFWEKAQATLRQKLGSRKWPVIMADLNDLIRAA
jgi:DNA-binding MarR family transcriptional regulator